MTTDLTMLTATGVLAALLILPYGLAMWTLWPIGEILGNRAGPSPALPAWAERAQRAQRNMLENLPHFAVFVLVAHAAGLSNTQTAVGATIFFWARLVHAVAYIAGLWQLRAPAFFAGLGGECLIITRLLGWSPAATTVGIAALAIAFVSTVVLLRRLAAPMHSGREGLSV
jgi:uncharacterized MAPEG superfamily protein